MEEKLIITPETKVYDLLNEFPQLEEVLIDISPFFKKLKNPVLRRTIAKVTNLRQAAAVGNVSLEAIINRLRKEIGQDKIENIKEEKKYKDAPKWFDENRIAESLDARPIINSGGHPLDTVIRAVKSMSNGNIYELITPFLPMPLIDKVEGLGYQSWSTQTEADIFKTYFIKS
ncbi:DUF1858 domain-containing protein [Bacteroidetes/Chlorobi group bacterium ChocPot_Mid]|nr:MAG: DUF1858 domain-containing protein [Bacteroidetes/Chlorobi group bacterium ChocPot_Mid]